MKSKFLQIFMAAIRFVGGRHSNPLQDGIDAYKRGDYRTAARFYRKAALQGDPEALNNLGLMYADGHGVQQDFSEAAALFRMASSMRHAGAQVNLARHYEHGRGVPQDDVYAHVWFSLAGEMGVEGRNRTAARMTQEKINEAQRLAAIWVPSTWEHIKETSLRLGLKLTS